MRGHPWHTVTAFWKTTMTHSLTVHGARFTGHVMNHLRNVLASVTQFGCANTRNSWFVSTLNSRKLLSRWR
jgi:hypothetical protein